METTVYFECDGCGASVETQQHTHDGQTLNLCAACIIPATSYTKKVSAARKWNAEHCLCGAYVAPVKGVNYPECENCK